MYKAGIVLRAVHASTKVRYLETISFASKRGRQKQPRWQSLQGLRRSSIEVSDAKTMLHGFIKADGSTLREMTGRVTAGCKRQVTVQDSECSGHPKKREEPACLHLDQTLLRARQ